MEGDIAVFRGHHALVLSDHETTKVRSIVNVSGPAFQRFRLRRRARATAEWAAILEIVDEKSNDN